VNRQANFVSGMLVGAGLMYMLDPARGRRRRALLRDQVVHGAHELEDVGGRIEGKSRDLRSRARGAVAETRARMQPEDVDDSVLEARVRTEIGRAVSNPGAVHVAAREGRVTLSGSVPEYEVEELLSRAASVRGVDGVENRLDVRADPGEVSGFQGAAH
jgi:osmotically-inducible protein OsmY